MKEYNFTQQPFKLFGLPKYYENGLLERIPQYLKEEVPNVWELGQRCPGARLCFRTDSKELYFKIILKSNRPDIGMSIFSAQSGNVYIGNRQTARYAGLITPENYNTLICEGTFTNDPGINDITVFLPRNEPIDDIIIGLDDDANIEAPTPYKYQKPIVYYGSSITEGGCCSKPANGYNAFISRWLDVDYYNLGFSGAAKGELCMADYINTIEKSIFVYDYDHNAPTIEHLAATHEPFFKRIREHSPSLPIVMMTRPNFDYGDAPERREIIKRTYENAVKNGDKNVYFVGGELFFGEDDRFACTNDCCHPNDLGMYRMAKVVAPIIEKILKSL